MQGLQKVMRIVISLDFCGMMTSSSAIVLRNMWVDLPYSIAFLIDIGRDCLSDWPGKKKID